MGETRMNPSDSRIRIVIKCDQGRLSSVTKTVTKTVTAPGVTLATTNFLGVGEGHTPADGSHPGIFSELPKAQGRCPNLPTYGPARHANA